LNSTRSKLTTLGNLANKTFILNTGVSKMSKKAEIAATEEKAHEVETVTTKTEKRTRKAAILLPTYSLKSIAEGDSIFIRIDSEIEEKPNMEDDGKQKMDNGKPMFLYIVRVTDLDSGQVGEMVLPYLILKALKSVQGGFKGKSFEFIKGAKKGRTNEWTSYELE
ncbi:MAG: hypothetical protein ACYC0J_10410, partial [Gammaproteobacteria bacterium]